MSNEAGSGEWCANSIVKAFTKKCASWRKYNTHPEDVVQSMEAFLAAMVEANEGNKPDDSELDQSIDALEGES